MIRRLRFIQWQGRSIETSFICNMGFSQLYFLHYFDSSRKSIIISGMLYDYSRTGKNKIVKVGDWLIHDKDTNNLFNNGNYISEWKEGN